LTEKYSNPTFTTKLDHRRLKLEILAADTTLSGSLFQKFMTRSVLSQAVQKTPYLTMLRNPSEISGFESEGDDCRKLISHFGSPAMRLW